MILMVSRQSGEFIHARDSSITGISHSDSDSSRRGNSPLLEDRPCSNIPKSPLPILFLAAISYSIIPVLKSSAANFSPLLEPYLCRFQPIGDPNLGPERLATRSTWKILKRNQVVLIIRTVVRRRSIPPKRITI